MVNVITNSDEVEIFRGDDFFHKLNARLTDRLLRVFRHGDRQGQKQCPASALIHNPADTRGFYSRLHPAHSADCRHAMRGLLSRRDPARAGSDGQYPLCGAVDRSRFGALHRAGASLRKRPFRQAGRRNLRCAFDQPFRMAVGHLV